MEYYSIVMKNEIIKFTGAREVIQSDVGNIVFTQMQKLIVKL